MISVLGVDNDGDCQRITVDGDGCVASVVSTAVTRAAPYNCSINCSIQLFNQLFCSTVHLLCVRV